MSVFVRQDRWVCDHCGLMDGGIDGLIDGLIDRECVCLAGPLGVG